MTTTQTNIKVRMQKPQTIRAKVREDQQVDVKLVKAGETTVEVAVPIYFLDDGFF